MTAKFPASHLADAQKPQLLEKAEGKKRDFLIRDVEIEMGIARKLGAKSENLPQTGSKGYLSILALSFKCSLADVLELFPKLSGSLKFKSWDKQHRK